jgi:hypothetical protein
MPQSDDAASAGVISEQAPAQSASTAVPATEQQTETQTTSTSILDRLGVPAEVQKELKEKQPAPEPEATPAAPAAEVAAPEPTTEPAEVTSEDHSEDLPKPNRNWDPETQGEFTNRVGKEARKRRKAIERAEKAEAEAEQLRAQLDGIQPVTVAPTATDVFANVQSEQQLEQAVGEARLARDFCRQHPQGYVENEGKPNERIVSPEEVATYLSRAEDAIFIEAPKKQQQLRQRYQSDRVAAQVYPQLFDKGSQDYQVANSVMQQLPGLINHPDRNLIIGDYLEGVKLRIAKDKPSGKANADIPAALTRPQAPLAPHVPAATARSTTASEPSRKKVEDAMNRLASGDGDMSDLTAAVAARRAARQTASNPQSLVSV